MERARRSRRATSAGTQEPAPVRWGRGGDRTADVPASRADVDAVQGSSATADGVYLLTRAFEVESLKAIYAAIDCPDLMLRSGDRSA
jgi:hypothetical protein